MAVRTFTHLYDDYEHARQTVETLQANGIPHDDISIVSNNADDRHAVGGTGSENGVETSHAGAGASTGTLVGGGIGLLTGIGLLAIPGVGPVVAAGWLVATLTGAGVGAAGGGLLGSLVHAGVPEEHAHAYAEGVRRGGTLVTVRGEESEAARIEQILDGRAPMAVDMTARRAEYETGGWKQFEETGPHYTTDQVAEERMRRSPPARTL